MIYVRVTVKKASIPMWMLLIGFRVFTNTASPEDQTGEALFSLISLIKKGKQCNEETPSRNQQTADSQKDLYHLIGWHLHHLLPM